MPHYGPIKRRDLIYFLRKVGFEGPYSGGNHQFMVKESRVLRIPNPHQSDISESLLVRILKQAGIDRADWEKL
jgi:predicted RNA binding protein YcfA (HicA-like mRNA interferase family)